MRLRICFSIALICASAALAEPPTAMCLFPAGGQRGTTVNVLAGGLFLNKSCHFEIVGQGVTGPSLVQRTASPRFEGPVLPLPESQRQEDYPQAMAAEIKIAADAKPGNRHVRLWTSQGVTLPLPFVVGDLPEIVEQEIEGDPIPIAVAAPLTINGRIYPREDEDHWSIQLKKGQTLHCEVEASSIGSPLEACLEIRDADGGKRAESHNGLRIDPRLQFVAPDDGEYRVVIADVRNGGGPAFVYRLTLRIGNSAEAQAGEPNQGRLVREADEQGDPVRANFLPIPATGVGRIGQPGEIDTWNFAAKKGETLEFAIQARRSGSPLLGVLSVRDAAGKSLASADPGANGDSSLRFTAPGDGAFSISVQDRFKSRGGADFTYHLIADRSKPDFDVTAAAASLTILRGQQANLKLELTRRGGLTSAIRFELEGLPAGVSLPKDPIIPAGQNNAQIQFKADAAAPIDCKTLRIKATALQPLLPFTAMPMAITRYVQFSAGDVKLDHLRLAVAIPTPFKIVGEYTLQLIPRGTVYSRKYKLERNGFTGPIEIALADKQARHLQGVTASPMTVSGDKEEFEYAINLPPWMETGRTCRVCVMGTATVKDADGKEHVVTFSSVQQNEQIIAVVEPERLSLKLDRETLRVEPGRDFNLDVTLGRGEGLESEATIEVVVPPHFKGVKAQNCRIPAGTKQGSLRIQFAKDAAGPYNAPLLIRATVQDGGRPVTAETQLELVVVK